jgi:peptidoglycan/LPS O-acetylase OafA/YrhL
MNGGFVGVDVFFVISGFVITSSLLRVTEGDHSLLSQLRNFYARRIRRLIPALGTLILFTILGSYFIESSWGEQQRTAKAGIASALSFSNFNYAFDETGYFSLAAKTNPLLHMWSLSIEEQFYLVFPVILLLLFGRDKYRKYLKATLFAILFVSFFLSILIGFQVFFFSGLTRGEHWSFYLPFTRSWEFLAGVLIALPANPKSRFLRIIGQSRSFSAIGAFGILLSVFSIHNWGVFPGFVALVPVLSTVLLIVCGSNGSKNLVTRLLSFQPLVSIGNVSYSWYLWHWPFIVFGQRLFPDLSFIKPISAVISIIPAYLSFQFIERFWREGDHKRRGSIPVILLLFVALPVFFSLLLNEKAGSQSPNSSRTDLLISDSNIGSCNFSEVSCFFLDPDAKKQMLLVGDSHAGSLVNVMEDVGAQSGFGLSVVSRPGCPFFDTELAFYLYSFESQNLMTKTECKKSYEEGVEWISSNPVDLTVFVANAPLYVGDPYLDSKFDLRVSCFIDVKGDCLRSRSATERLAQYQKFLDQSVQEILQYSDHVVLMAPLPYQYRDPSGFIKDSDGNLGTPRDAVDQIRSQILKALIQVASTDSRITFFDPIDTLCNVEICPESGEGVSLYSDNSHLSLYGSSLLKESLKGLLVIG